LQDEKRLVQLVKDLQKRFDQSITLLGSLQHKTASLRRNLGKMTEAKEVNAQVSCKTHFTDAIAAITTLNVDKVVIICRPLSCLWETSNAMATSDGCVIFVCSVVGCCVSAEGSPCQCKGKCTLLFSPALSPHVPPLSSPSILAAMILLAHNDVWLIVAVLANPPHLHPAETQMLQHDR